MQYWRQFPYYKITKDLSAYLNTLLLIEKIHFPAGKLLLLQGEKDINKLVLHTMILFHPLFTWQI